MSRFLLTVIHDTWAKTVPIDSSHLQENVDKFRLVKGEEYYLDAVSSNNKANHTFVTLSTNKDGQRITINGKNSLYFYTPHIRLTKGSPSEEDDHTGDPGTKVRIVGVGLVGLSEPISKTNFTWGEATHGGERLPESPTVTTNIIRLANALQPHREAWDRPFHITSWYRPKYINDQVGGASNSAHLRGGACDFYVDGLTREDLWDYFDPRWDGGCGVYTYDRYIIHLDIESKRRWGLYA